MNSREPMFQWYERSATNTHELHRTARFKDTPWDTEPVANVLRAAVEKWRMVMEKCNELAAGNDEEDLPIDPRGTETCAACVATQSCHRCLLNTNDSCCGGAHGQWENETGSRVNARAVLAHVEAVRNTIVDNDPTIPLRAFLDAAKANLSGTGNGLVNAWVDDDTQCVIIHVSRYATDGVGGHMDSHEEYYGTLAIIPHNDEKVVVPSAMQIHWEPARPPVEITEIDAEARLRDNGIDFNREEDDLVDLAGEHGLYEGDYCPPDDDFAWQELEHHLSEIIQVIKEQVK